MSQKTEWVLVPKEPTSNMLAAMSGEWHPSRHDIARKEYAAAIAAAPPAPEAQAEPVTWAANFAAEVLAELMDHTDMTDDMRRQAAHAIDHIETALAAQQPAPEAQAVPDEREAFEAWGKTMGKGEDGWWFRQLPDGGYSAGKPDFAWTVWQARAALAAQQPAPEAQAEPRISTEHGPWIPSKNSAERGETYCQRCLTRDKFRGARACEPHIVYDQQPAPAQPLVMLSDDEISAMEACTTEEGPTQDELNRARSVLVALRVRNGLALKGEQT
jgi:hypothetical protein